MKRKTTIKKGQYHFRKQKFLIVLTIGLVTFPLLAGAQQLTSSTIGSIGGTFSDGTTSWHYSMGEIATELLNNSNNMLSQGFLQGNQSGVGINETSVDASRIIIFPNPATDVITIQNSETRLSGTCRVKNICGVTVKQGLIENGFASIDVTFLAPGLYLIQIQVQGQSIIVKKFIKK
ncbi:MAG: hypothetical protein DRJ09_11530 [Bacteroidetes bacterium]|nr:MAG: hypothetical protein DRJ09_11530 [Bacteroidota bacterium]